MVPPQVQWVCPYEPAKVSLLTRVAARERMTINSGHVGRAPRGMAQQCQTQQEEPLDAASLYVVSDAHREDPGFRNANCREFEGLWLCSTHGQNSLGATGRK
jgi:hypothetical protein